MTTSQIRSNQGCAIAWSGEMRQRRVENQAGEQDEAGVAIRFKHDKAIVRIGNVEADNLPGEVPGESGKSDRENRAGAGQKSSGADENYGDAVEHAEHRLGARPEQ